MLSPITNGRRYSAGDDRRKTAREYELNSRRKQYQPSHHRHLTFLDLPAFMAAGRTETFENLSTREPSKRDTLASSSEPFSARTVSKRWSEDTNAEDGPGQSILALDRALSGTEKSLDSPRMSLDSPKMQGGRIRRHHHTYDASGLTAVPAGFGGLITPKTRTLEKLPALVPLSAAALAAHEASYANEDNEECHVSEMNPLSPRFIEWKARQEAKRTGSKTIFGTQVHAIREPKRKTKEELDAEFQEVFADMEEEIGQQFQLELHQHWADEMLQQRRDRIDYARKNAVYYVDHILGADWNKVQHEEAGRNRGPLKAKVEKIQARLPRRLTLVDHLDEERGRLDEFLHLHANTCRGDDDSDSEDDISEDDFGEDSGSASD